MPENKETQTQELRLVVTYQDGSLEIYEDFSEFLTASVLKNTHPTETRSFNPQTDELLLIGIDI